MAPNIPISDSTPDWAEQLRLACQTLSRSKMRPAMIIHLTGELVGATGQAMSLLLLVKRLAAEYDLQQQASLRGRTLSVRLSAAQRSFPMKGQ